MGFPFGYKPWWMFWHPGSGLIGGMVFGAVLSAVLLPFLC